MTEIFFALENWDEAMATYRYLLRRTHPNHRHLGEITAHFSGTTTEIWSFLGLCEAQRRRGRGLKNNLCLHVTGGTDYGARLSPMERAAYNAPLCRVVGGEAFLTWHIPRDLEEDRFDNHILAPAYDRHGRLRCRNRAAFLEELRQCCETVTAELNRARLARGDYTLGNVDASWQVYYVQPAPEVELPAPRPAEPEANVVPPVTPEANHPVEENPAPPLHNLSDGAAQPDQTNQAYDAATVSPQQQRGGAHSTAGIQTSSTDETGSENDSAAPSKPPISWEQRTNALRNYIEIFRDKLPDSKTVDEIELWREEAARNAQREFLHLVKIWRQMQAAVARAMIEREEEEDKERRRSRER